MKKIKISKICEVCGQEAKDLINIGLDLGYHIGDYGKGDYEKLKIEPVCVGVTSIYLCSFCKYKIEQTKYFGINILPELKELIKRKFIKNMIIEGLK